MFLFFFLLLSHLIISETTSTTQLPCPSSSIECKNLGSVLYNSTDPACTSLFKLNCSSNPPKLHLNDTRILEIKNISANGRRLLVFIKTFDQHLKNRNCDVFDTSLALPGYLSIPPRQRRLNITFFKCITKPMADSSSDGYNEFKECNFYYKISSINNYSTPTNCVNLTLPYNQTSLKPPYMNQTSFNHSDLFSLLSAEFWIRIQPRKCLLRPTQCQVSKGDDEKTNRKLIIIAVLVGCVIIFTLATAIFLIHRAYKRKAFAYYSSKDKSRELEDVSVYFGVSVFSYDELQDATNRFDSSKELGDGGFGTVYYGKLRDGREVAVKRLYEHNYKRVQQFMNEVEILTRLRHKNLVSLYGCTSRRSRELLLVYEYISNGTVADHLHGDRAKLSPLTWQTRMKIAIETASALVYLHASEIIHRDVKSNNILLENNFCVKVADFGLSRLLPNDMTHVSTAPQGTPGYVDPEYHQCYQLTDKSDVYSFGVVLIELISSMPAIDISRSRDEISLANMALNRIQRCALDELIDPSLGSDVDTERMTTSVAELAFRCLQFDSETRPTMHEALEVLKGIQGDDQRRSSVDDDEDINVEMMINQVVNNNKLSEVPPPPSPENEGVGLLKGRIIMASPISVTAKWHSTSSTGSITPNTSTVCN